MLKYQILIKLFVFSFVLIRRVYGDTIQAEVVMFLYSVTSKLYICKLNYFDVLCNITIQEYLPEDGHKRWPKHVGGYAFYNKINLLKCVWGHAVAQLVEALRYKSEGRGSLEFFIHIILLAALWSWGRLSL